MDYADLTANIARWVNRPEIDQAIDAFIELTEADLDRRLAEAGISGGEGRSVSSIEAEYGPAPTDLGRVVQLRRLWDGEEVEALSAAAFAATKAADPDAEGPPDYYLLSGASFRYYPAPDRLYDLELTYQKRLPPLAAEASSNWLIERHPDTYLYGALVRAAEYLGGDPRLATWQGLYESAIAGALSAERGRRGERRSRHYRAEVPLGLN